MSTMKRVLLGLLLATPLSAAPTLQEEVAQLEKKGKIDVAIEKVTTYLEAHPEQGSIHLLRSRLLWKAGQSDEAEFEATLAFGLSGGKDPDARKQLDEIRTRQPLH
jgi:hypothetical protein